MRYCYGTLAVTGFALVAWAMYVNPVGARVVGGKPRAVVTAGPYRFLSHPMYVGEWLLISGLAGIAAGFWNFLAVGIVAELLLRDWTLRERRPQ